MIAKMKIRILTFLVLVTLLNLSLFLNPGVSIDYTQDSGNQCNIPTLTLHISCDSNSFAYNVTSINAPKNTCVTIIYSNPSTVAHTFTIDSVASDNVSYFNIYLNPGVSATANFITPNLDKTYQFYCSVPGHKAAGEVGNLIVGLGSPSSSQTSTDVSIIPTSDFPMFTIFLAIPFLVFTKRKNKF